MGTDYMFACNEPNGARIRRVSRLDPMPRTVVPLFKKLRAWNPKLAPAQIAELYRQDKIYWTVDDVGLIWLTLHPAFPVEGHFVFWDGRLRGREKLVRGMADVAMELAASPVLWCKVPTQHHMLRAFLTRVGFTENVLGDGWSNMTLQNPTRRAEWQTRSR